MPLGDLKSLCTTLNEKQNKKKTNRFLTTETPRL